MSVSELTLDNISPLIQYHGSWRAGDDTDPEFSKYSNGGTFAVTQSNSATATVTFNGTGITVYGAKRTNHNQYSVSLDGAARINDGHADPEIFNAALYSVQGLLDTTHTFVLQDASNSDDLEESYLDLDYVVIQTTLAGSNSVNVQGFELSWAYAPSSTDWEADAGLSAATKNNSYVTSTANATATLTFTGSGIDLYGVVCKKCGQYSVTIDDGEEGVFNANNAAWNQNGQVLYFARDLEEKQHTMRFSNIGGSGSLVGIDKAVIYGEQPGGVTPLSSSSAASSGSNTGSSAAATSTSLADGSNPTSKHKLPIAEIVCGVLAALLLLLGIFVFFLLRQRKRRNRRPGPVGKWRDSFVPSSPSSAEDAIASPFRMSMQQRPFSPTNSNAAVSINLDIRPPTPSIRAPSPSLNPFSDHHSIDRPTSGVFSDSSRGSDLHALGLADDQSTLSYGQQALMSPPASIRRAPSPALRLHEAPPAYDHSSRPPSVVLSDRKQ